MENVIKFPARGKFIERKQPVPKKRMEQLSIQWLDEPIPGKETYMPGCDHIVSYDRLRISGGICPTCALNAFHEGKDK